MTAAETAKVLAALGHTGRLSIFRLLAQTGPRGLPAGEVARRLGLLQNTTSTHLGVLSNVGLVSARREGRSIIYAAAASRFNDALAFLTGDLFGDHSEASQAFLQRLLDASGGFDSQPVRAAARDDNAA
jgi:DNA-binding transcriptional ArsR family regulator